MAKNKKNEEEIKIKPSYKHRVPHKPTKVHRNKKKYSRKGKTKNKIRKEISSETEKKEDQDA
ncbi:hypothetical protein KAX97_01035 [candidate division WOR-3 bacterium]|nr:hypothetical protein [candidate division WOR-3 bacterium]